MARLLIVAQPLVAGVPQHILDLVAELDEASYEVTVACPRRSALSDGLASRPSVRRLPFTAHRKPHHSDLLWVMRLLPTVRASDVVHAHSSKAAWLARLAALLAGRRRACIVTPHCWSFWAVTGHQRRALIAMERVAAHACAAIVAVSRHERNVGLASRIGLPNQYHVIPNGIDLRRFEVPRSPDPDCILMVGRLVPQKRPELAVRAMAVARRSRASLRLEIVGAGELQDALVRLATELGVEGSVVLRGTSDDVPTVLARAGCLLVTSAYEGCSLTVLEAMAVGVPVVAVRIGGMDELLEDGVSGLLCSDAPEDIARTLVRLRDDPKEAHRLGEEARRRAREHHSRRRMAQELSALYDTVAKSSR